MKGEDWVQVMSHSFRVEVQPDVGVQVLLLADIESETASRIQCLARRQLLCYAVHIPSSDTDVLAPDADDLSLRKQ